MLEGYEHIGTVGEGYFALVTRYRHSATGGEVAVKALKSDHRTDPESQRRLAREIEILEHLQEHLAVVPLLGRSAESTGPDIAYMMPLAASNLYDFIRRNNTKLDPEDRATLFDRVLQAIAAAHERGYLHRDICPSNVLVLRASDPRSVVVADFGLGRDLTSVLFD
ncbi:MAG: protein kinase family protein [Candidatus Eiseniibacteriota bacterium]